MKINSVLKFHCILDGPCSFTFLQAHERLNNATYPIFMVTPIAVVHCLESSNQFMVRENLKNLIGMSGSRSFLAQGVKTGQATFRKVILLFKQAVHQWRIHQECLLEQ